MSILTNIFAKRIKQLVAPLLLTPAEYWGYIQTKQAFLEANRRIIRYQLLMGLFFSWVFVFGFLSSVLSFKGMYFWASVLSLVSVLWYVITVKKKWWYGLTLLLSMAALVLVLLYFYQSGILVRTFGLAYIFVVYLVLSHLIMLLRSKSIAVAAK